MPALHEFVPGYEASGWNCLCAPRETPADIVEKLNRAVNDGLVDPRLKARFADLGATPFAGSSVDLGKHIAYETEKWGDLIRATNIKLE